MGYKESVVDTALNSIDIVKTDCLAILHRSRSASEIRAKPVQILNLSPIAIFVIHAK